MYSNKILKIRQHVQAQGEIQLKAAFKFLFKNGDLAAI